MSPIQQALNSIAANIKLSSHSYGCSFLSNGIECDCDSYSDEEIAKIVFASYGYGLIRI